MAQTQLGGLDEPVDQSAQAQGRQGRTHRIEPARGGGAALGHSGEKEQNDDRDGHVEKKCPAPGVIDQPAAKERPDRGRDPAEPRPGADRAPPLARLERGGDERERPGYEERPSNPLERSGENEPTHRGRESAGDGRDGEQRDPHGVDEPAAKPVPQGSADQEQRRKQERVRFDHPLHLDRGRSKLARDRRQRDRDHRAVDECQAGAEDGRGEDPGARRAGRHGNAMPTPDRALVAGEPDGVGHGAYDLPCEVPASYSARTNGTSTTCSATNHTWASFVRMTELTMRSLVPSSPRSEASRAIVRASFRMI